MMRTWTATIELRAEGWQLTLPVPESEYDLLRDQTIEAVGLASKARLDGGIEVRVVLYKTTKARGTVKDRSFSVFRDRRGQVRYQ